MREIAGPRALGALNGTLGALARVLRAPDQSLRWRRRWAFARGSLCVQERKLGQRFLRFAAARRARINFQKLFVGFLRLCRVSQLVPLQARETQQRIGTIAASGIFVDEELIGVRSGLEIAAAETVAHFGVEFRDGHE